MENTTINIWFAVNKNGFVGLYCDEPKRNIDNGKWESDSPFLNSVIYNQISDLVKRTKFSWNNNPECITFSTQK